MQSHRNSVFLLLILVVVAGLFTGRAFFFNIAYLFASLLILSFLWAFLSAQWISLSRKTRTRRAQVGGSISEAFEVRNRAILPKLWLEIRDHSDLPYHRASHVIPAMGINGNHRWYVETPCIIRGQFNLGPMTLISSDPFGLFFHTRKINSLSHVTIYPATVPITQFHLPAGIISGGETQNRRAHFVTTNAVGVREYVTGDSYNRVHWRSTARRDNLMVKEFELDPIVDLWLFVDFSAQSLVESPTLQRAPETGVIIPGSETIPPSTEEYNVVIAASLAKLFIDQDRALGFTAYTPHRELFQPERGNQQLMRIFQCLATARNHSPYSLREMLTLETPNLGRGTTLIIITSSITPDWINEAQILSRRGIRPMCVFVDPQTFNGHSNTREVKEMLRLARIPSIIINRNDDLSAALAQRPI